MASYTELRRTEPPITTRPTHLLAAGQRLAFALGLLSIPGAVLPDDIDVVNDLAYLVVASYPEGELRVLDLSEPTVATELVGYPLPPVAAGRGRVRVVGGIAYVSSSYGNSGRLSILDMSAPNKPIELSLLSLPWPALALDVAVDGSSIYLSGPNGEVMMVDVSDPAEPKFKAERRLPS